MRRVAFALLSLALPATLAEHAQAAEGTELVSGFDEGQPWLSFGISYDFVAHRAAIKREFSGMSGTGGDGVVPTVKDLLFSEDRHTIVPHLQIGLYRDLMITASLPYVVGLRREYTFDQRADPCVYPGGTQTATCINAVNSSTMIDGLLPHGTPGPMGYNADDPATNFAPGSSTVFRSVNRSGIDQLHLGLTWAPMNQDRDDTKPTWTISAEVLWSIGKIMKWNRMDPGSEDGVARGVHEIRLETSVSKRLAWAEPFVSFWWQAPLAVRGDRFDDANGSLFWNVGFGQKTKSPQQSGGTRFGFEAIVYDKPEDKQRVSIQLEGRIEGHFGGLNYSEMWEVFAYAGEVTGGAKGPLAIDIDPTRADDNAVSHPGVTTIENYLTFAGKVGVRAQLGRHARLYASFSLAHDQTHLISAAEAGTPATPGGIIMPGTAEVNPLHVALIDQAGRRYIVDESSLYSFLAGGEILF